MPKLTEELTEKVLRSLPVPATGNVLYYDPELKGFAGRVTSKGARAFVGVYHFEGVERRDTIGALGVWKAKAAREAFKRWRRDVDLGVDPRGEPAREEPEDSTFKARAEQYLVDPRKKRQETPLRPATIREYRRALLVYAEPLHDKPFEAIGRRDVADLLDKVKAERGAVSAMRARAAIGRLYSWGMARGYVEHSPVTGTEGWESAKRDRELSDTELRMVWAATAVPTAYSLIVRTMTRTGARPAEVGGMSKAELQDLDGTWEFPADRAKNGRPLALPLPRQAREAIATWQAAQPWRDPIFGRLGSKPFSGWSAAKRQLDERIARTNAERRLGRRLAEGEEPAKQDYMKPWQLRDLRRTVETRLASIGVPQEIINRVLNHAQGPITTTYNRYEYLKEKSEALQRWADELDRIVSPPATDNIVRLTERR
jgi:integrase